MSSLFVSSLNSGSNGNCYYIGNDQEAILVDVGISCREIEKRMTRLGLSLHLVKAIFISHEHTDHIKGLYRLANKYQLAVYISQGTLAATGFTFPLATINIFNSSLPIQIGTLQVIPFAKYHDATDPYSFVITNEQVKIGVFTDIGRVCDRITYYFKQCHAVFLEANYDEDMLNNGRYPYFLKKRISGGHGHLSNKQALDLFLSHRTDELSLLLLSHLSKDNNCPDLVARLFKEHAGSTEIVVASRYEESLVYEVTSRASMYQDIEIQYQDISSKI
ncbi:MBL fold metallo-hydrolase [Olivibacter domesticus]|uniref:Phosphoribosyl 1,2-cyclic phosphodiesterase n=1 Tax=Olivibacter domesticus TaxID=407022 RepID=A0A1H7TLD7_OLID1|nr:MBL fold metallo-hydrolase [Olivibacter domesticus]SEL85309.1 Phosphoribosyl 1,2-cyclic phosphodiesterase [Olivibacter domesticus]